MSLITFRVPHRKSSNICGDAPTTTAHHRLVCQHSSTPGLPLQATFFVWLRWLFFSRLVSFCRATDGERDLPFECAAEDREGDHVRVLESFELALGEDSTEARRFSASNNAAETCSTQRESSSLIVAVASSMLARLWCQRLQRL